MRKGCSTRRDGEHFETTNAGPAGRPAEHPFLESNQLRLWLASLAYLLVERVAGADAGRDGAGGGDGGDDPEKLFKVAAAVRVSTAGVCATQFGLSVAGFFELCQRRLMALVPDS